MKYIIPQDKIDKVVFKYLDLNLKGLEKRKPKNYKGIVFAYPDEKYGILGCQNDGTLVVLFIYYELINEISETFGLNKSESKSIISRWFNDRYQLEVIDTDWCVLINTMDYQ